MKSNFDLIALRLRNHINYYNEKISELSNQLLIPSRLAEKNVAKGNIEAFSKALDIVISTLESAETSSLVVTHWGQLMDTGKIEIRNVEVILADDVFSLFERLAEDLLHNTDSADFLIPPEFNSGKEIKVCWRSQYDAYSTLGINVLVADGVTIYGDSVSTIERF